MPDAIEDGQSRRRERTAVLALAVTVLALTNLPHLWGSTIRFEGQVFSGFVYTYTFYDILSYLAKMRDGLEGGWFYTNPFTTEEPKPVFLFVFYIALGHGARIAGLSLVAAYHLARIGAGVFLLFAVDRLIRSFGWRGSARLFGFGLVFLGGGFGWTLRWGGIDPAPVEFMQTEGFCFQSMASYPHFALALALMAWIVADGFRYAAGNATWGAITGSAMASFALAWVHPRPLLTLMVVGAIAAVWGAARGAASWRRWALFLGALALAAAGPMAVSLATVRADPLWTEWSRTPTLSAPPWQYLIAYGLMWPLALAGAWYAVRRNEAWAPVLVGWLVAGSVLPYLPIAAQGRLIIGWNIPVALLSGYTLGTVVVPGLARAPASIARMGPAIVGALCLLLALTPIAYLGAGVDRVLRGTFPGYFAEERAEAMAWLAGNTGRADVVLSSVPTGMFIPAYAGNRVVQGHWAETFDPERKRRSVNEIFAADTEAERREALLTEFGVRYLFYGQWERELGAYDPAEDTQRWRPRWEGEFTIIYERVPFKLR
jgi:hypothetical protein